MRGCAGLEAWQFTQIAQGGLGDPYNAYPHSMAWFRGCLYVGMMRATLCLLKRGLSLPVEQWPVRCPEDVYDLDLRAQIWRYDPRQQEWRQVYISPMVTGRSGDIVPRELSYRSMVVFQEAETSRPALYVTTWGPSKAIGPLILRSFDGEEFEVISEPGLGDPTVSAFRSLIPFRGRLYTAPTGRMGGKPNTPDNPLVLESAFPGSGEWYPVSKPGFGDETNLTIFEMAAFQDHLYAGTLNAARGFQIWKTRAEGRPPYVWTPVITDGAYRGPRNETTVSMFVFRDALYVGSGIQNGGYDRTHQVGPDAPELIRIHPDDSWELLVGEPRSTPEGYKRPLSGFGSGFGNALNGYFWRMAEYEGHLYVGTFNSGVLLPYMRMQSDSRQQRIARWLGVENLVRFVGGFDLFRSPDGIHWDPVTTDGFGNPYNYGARTMLGTPYGLFVGTANPFGPEIAVRMYHGWEYVANPRGGVEIWLGRDASRPFEIEPEEQKELSAMPKLSPARRSSSQPRTRLRSEFPKR